MYGEKKQWGCKWFQLWREHIKKSVSLNQRLQIFYFEGQAGKGVAANLFVAVDLANIAWCARQD
jgi:hypothetical protein